MSTNVFSNFNYGASHFFPGDSLAFVKIWGFIATTNVERLLLCQAFLLFIIYLFIVLFSQSDMRLFENSRRPLHLKSPNFGGI
jgi:hypothetical protein